MRAAALAVALLVLTPGPSAAQSVLERPPNMDGTWSARPGVVHFHFLHRFSVSEGAVKKVFNSPTFLLAAGLPVNLLVAGRYASNSTLVVGEPNEWEVYGRWLAPGELPLELALQGGWNGAAESVDGELALGRDFGPLRLLGAARAFSAFAGGGDAVALAGGARLRLRDHVALAGDVAGLVSGPDTSAAWSVGLQLGIPYTPHSLSLHVSNANTTTLQGASLGAGDHRWGFEFTVPITLSRYIGGRATAAPVSGSAVPRAAVVVDMTDRLRFSPDTVRIAAGETVEWRNGSRVIHTVTADAAKAVDAASVRLPAGARPFDSGDIPPGGSFRHTFEVAGAYVYFCIPHELGGMVGVVVVER